MAALKLVDAILKMLQALFKIGLGSIVGGGSNGPGQSPEKNDPYLLMVNKLESLNRSVMLEKMDALAKGDTVKADMYSAILTSTTLMIDDFKASSAKGSPVCSPEELSDKISGAITKGLESNESKSAFNDFTNHGAKTDKAMAAVLEKVSEITSRVDFGPANNKMNGLFEVACGSVHSHYKTHPLTPRQENGIDEKPTEQDMSITQENKIEASDSKEASADTSDFRP